MGGPWQYDWDRGWRLTWTSRAAENLDGDIAVEASVAGAIDLAHSTHADTLLHLVDAEQAAGERGFISVAFDLRHSITVSPSAGTLRICWNCEGLALGVIVSLPKKVLQSRMSIH